jgi:hypothetical protein
MHVDLLRRRLEWPQLRDTIGVLLNVETKQTRGTASAGSRCFSARSFLNAVVMAAETTSLNWCMAVHFYAVIPSHESQSNLQEVKACIAGAGGAP